MSRVGRVLAVLPMAFLAVFFLYPLGTVLARGLTGETSDPLTALATASLWRVAWFTSWQAVLSTLLTTVVALPGAWVLSHRRFRGRALVRALSVVPFVLPTVVVATAFTALFASLGVDDGRFGLGQSTVAIILAHVFFNYAVVLLTVSTVWERLDIELEHEARMLGATPWQAFRMVTLPRLAPALLGSASIVFLFSFTSFGVVLLLGGPRKATLDTEIWRYATQRGELDVAAVISVLQLVAVAAVLVLSTVLQRRYAVRQKTRGVSRARRAIGRSERVVQWLCLTSIALVSGAPVLALVERSLRTDGGYGLTSYRSLASADERVSVLPDSALAAVGNSLWIAAIATVVATSVGLGAAVVSERGGRLGRLTEGAFLLPLGTSGVLLGLGFLLALDERPLDLRTSWVLIPLAQALVGLPFVLRAVLPVISSIDEGLREAAAMLGATPTRVWRAVDLPAIWRATLMGAGFAFAVSLGEFGATVFISRPERLTVPVAIFRLLGRPGSAAQGQALSLSVILMALTAVSVLFVERLRPRGSDGW
jgi:thiamine transport system permease protein